MEPATTRLPLPPPLCLLFLSASQSMPCRSRLGLRLRNLSRGLFGAMTSQAAAPRVLLPGHMAQLRISMLGLSPRWLPRVAAALRVPLPAHNIQLQILIFGLGMRWSLQGAAAPRVLLHVHVVRLRVTILGLNPRTIRPVPAMSRWTGAPLPLLARPLRLRPSPVVGSGRASWMI